MKHLLSDAARGAFLSVSISILLMSSVGCTKLEIAQLGHYRVGEPSLLGIIPKTGIWDIRWATHPGAPLRTLDGTQTLLVQGEKAGFEADPEAGVIGVGGERRLNLERLPAQAQVLVWYHREKRETQFGREVDKAMAFTGEAAKIAAAAALVGGMTYLALQEEQTTCNCGTYCRCQKCSCWHH